MNVRTWLATVALMAPPTYYDDIRPQLAEHCLGCHSDQGVAFRLDQPEPAYGFRAAIVDAVLERRMPPWKAVSSHQDYVGDPSLDAATLDLFEQWRQADYPKGKVRADPSPSRGPHAFEPDLTLEATPKGGYTPRTDVTDDYRCFVFEWPKPDDPIYVTALQVRPGNLRIAHHANLFAVPAAHRNALKRYDAADMGEGYECFGSPLPDKLMRPEHYQQEESRDPGRFSAISREHYWLTMWGPGVATHRFPKNAGTALRPGTMLVLQIHYNTAFTKARDPGTTVEFELAKKVRKPGVNMLFSDPRWLLGEQNRSLVIPPKGSITVNAETSFEWMTDYIAAVAGRDVRDFSALEIHSVALHMHRAGVSGTVDFTDTSGHRERLLEVPRFQFSWQQLYLLKHPKRIPLVSAKDVTLSVSCTFANPFDEPIFGGYRLTDEMCLNFSFIALAP